MKYDVFISYSSEDQKLVEAMSHFLEEYRLRCFVAYRDVPKGEDWGSHITKAIKDSKVFVYIHTQTSNNSKETTREINLAFKYNCVVFPFRIVNVEYADDKAYRLSNVNWLDAFPETPENYFGRLFDDIKVHFPEIVQHTEKGALIRIETDMDCRIIRFKEELAVAKSGDITEIRLPKGTHKLTFEGLECKDDSYSTIYEVKDLEYEGYIEVNLLEKHNAVKAEFAKAKQERIEKEKREAEEKRRKKELERIEREAKAEQAKNKQTSETINGHEYVDLGLPSGLKWATCNVGANKPEEYGDYFAWGEKMRKFEYSKENCSSCGKQMGDISGNVAYDVARKRWGMTWRIPTKAEIKELLEVCAWTWYTHNSINGYKVTGPNGNYIFLPSAGILDKSLLCKAGFSGFYWSSTPSNDGEESCALCFNDTCKVDDFGCRYGGLTIRPITE